MPDKRGVYLDSCCFIDMVKEGAGQTLTTDRAQANRFIKAAREAGCSEDEAEIRENMKRIASVKVAKPDAPTK